MGVRLRIDYPHFPDLRPLYLSNEQVQALAGRARHQLGCADGHRLKIPLDLLRSIGGATVNGVAVDFLWDVVDSVTADDGAPALGVCDHDPEEMPGVVMLLANAGLIGDWEALLRSVLAHELGHGVCDAPAWVLASRNAVLPGLLGSAAQMRTRAVTPDDAHLFEPRRMTAERFSEYRANEFMGSFLVPQRLLLEPLGDYARTFDVPLLERPAPPQLPLAAGLTEARIAIRRGAAGGAQLVRLHHALAGEFGVTPRFIEVRLLRYGLIETDGPSGTAPQSHRRSL